MYELTNQETRQQELGERTFNRFYDASAFHTLSTLLTYHELIDVPCSDQYSVSSTQFERHLGLISRLAHESKMAEDYIAISFDDGHVSNFSSAMPLLSRYRLRGVFFITAGWIETKSDYMNWDQIKALLAAGHTVQSHGWSHKFLSKCSDSELQHELIESKRVLEHRLNISVTAISIPGGRWDERVLRACAHAGYSDIYTSDPLFTPTEKHGVRIHGRMMVRRSMSPNELEKFLTVNRFYLFNLRLRHQSKLLLRTLMTDAIYHHLWRRLSGRQGRPAEAIRIP